VELAEFGVGQRQEGLVVLVLFELLPFRLVRVGQHDAVIGKGAETFRAEVVAFLGRGQQRMQDLDRRLEHFHELHQALVGAAQRARVTIGVGIILRVMFEHSNIDLADQR